MKYRLECDGEKVTETLDVWNKWRRCKHGYYRGHEKVG